MTACVRAMCVRGYVMIKWATVWLQCVAAVLFCVGTIGVQASGSAGHAHHMEKMWADMLSRPEGMAVTVTADEQGTLWMVRASAGHLWLSHSIDAGKHFSEGIKINPEPEAIFAEGQNRPQLAVRNGVIAVAWSQGLPALFTGNVRFARSVDGGRTFSPPITVNDDASKVASHGFVAMTMRNDGRTTLAWLDGRDRSAHAGHQAADGSAIYFASADRTGRFTANQKLVGRTCECCRIAMALDRDGVPVVLWRSLFDGGVRDFALARVQEKTTVVRASQDNWQISACPHHGGDIAIESHGVRHLVWFTGHPEQPGLRYRRIEGDKMSEPLAFGNVDAQASYPAVFARDEVVQLAWREFDGKQYQLLTQRSRDSGQHWSPARVVASVEGNADIPMFVASAEKPLLVWNSASKGVQIFAVDAP